MSGLEETCAEALEELAEQDRRDVARNDLDQVSRNSRAVESWEDAGFSIVGDGWFTHQPK